MAVTLTVALVGDPRRGEGHFLDDYLPWVDRPKVELTVDEARLLGEVLRDAAAELMPGTPWPEAFVDFYVEGINPRLRRELFLLDAEGHVRTTWEWANEPLGEIVRAGDAGVLVGDPRRPYLLNQQGFGNGVITDWPTFLELLELWWKIAGGLATAGGVWGFFKMVGGVIRRRGPESVEIAKAHALEWNACGLRPDNLRDLLGSRPWDAAELALRLGCTEQEAVALLVGLGHAQGDDGLWTPADDEGSRMLRGNIDIMVHAGMTTDHNAISAELQARATELVESGRAAPVNWQKVHEMPRDLSHLPPPPDDEELEEPGTLGDDLRFAASYLGGSFWRRASRRVRRWRANR